MYLFVSTYVNHSSLLVILNFVSLIMSESLFDDDALD